MWPTQRPWNNVALKLSLSWLDINMYLIYLQVILFASYEKAET